MRAEIYVTRFESTDDASLYVASCRLPKLLDWPEIIRGGQHRVQGRAIAEAASLLMNFLSMKMLENPDMIQVLTPIDIQVDPKPRGRGV